MKEDSAMERLRALAKAARDAATDVERAEMLATTFEIGAEALGRRRSYANRAGANVEFADPDFTAALRALELASEIRDAIKEPPGHASTDVPDEEAVAELERMGFRLIPISAGAKTRHRD